MRKPPEHLTENAQKALLLSDEERISYARRPRFIEYTEATKILEKLEELFTHPKTHRMPNLLIKGDTNNGKTMIINQFRKQHPPCDNEEGEAVSYPVLVIQSPPMPDEGRLYNAILEELRSPYRKTDHPDKKLFQAVRILDSVGTRTLILDEIHDLLSGTSKKQQQALNVIKQLGNRVKISIVAVGTEKASNVFACDPQLSNRFKTIALPRWTIDGKGRDEFLDLLDHFEKILPLHNPSKLTEQKPIILKLHAMSEGLIGELFDLLAMACIEAIKRRQERITLKILECIEWQTPSQRKGPEL